MTDHLKPWTLMPPAEGVCQTCAVDHDPASPHNRDSLYYQYAFYRQHGHWPTWRDAMDHCTEEMREAWLEALRERGVSEEALG